MSDYDYIRDPAEIYRRSFAIVNGEADLAALPEGLAVMARRMIHACGMPDILADLAYSQDVADRARTALEGGAPVLADCRMVVEGIIRRRLPADNEVICTLNDPDVPQRAARIGNTRSAAAVDLWLPHLDGAVVVIGNAPTALFHLLEHLRDGAPKPAAILGFPVGFVGAAESKDALAVDSFGVPFITLRGRRGGSAIASAAVNALGHEK